LALRILGFQKITRVKIGTVEIDVSLSEDHLFRAEITENPVEDGTIFSDNVVLQPVVLEIEGRISDASQATFEFRGPNKAADAFQALVKLQRSRKTFEVTTAIQVYKNMMFKQLSVPRAAPDGR